MKSLRLWWKWRKAKRKTYPLRYTGVTHTVRGSTIEYGTPLRPAKGPRGAQGALRFEAPDGIIRILPISQIEWR